MNQRKKDYWDSKIGIAVSCDVLRRVGSVDISRRLNGVKDSKGHATQSPLLTNNLACQVHPHLSYVTNVELEERASTSTSRRSGRATGKAGC